MFSSVYNSIEDKFDVFINWYKGDQGKSNVVKLSNSEEKPMSVVDSSDVVLVAKKCTEYAYDKFEQVRPKKEGLQSLVCKSFAYSKPLGVSLVTGLMEGDAYQTREEQAEQVATFIDQEALAKRQEVSQLFKKLLEGHEATSKSVDAFSQNLEDRLKGIEIVHKRNFIESWSLWAIGEPSEEEAVNKAYNAGFSKVREQKQDEYLSKMKEAEKYFYDQIEEPKTSLIQDLYKQARFALPKTVLAIKDELVSTLAGEGSLVLFTRLLSKVLIPSELAVFFAAPVAAFIETKTHGKGHRLTVDAAGCHEDLKQEMIVRTVNMAIALFGMHLVQVLCGPRKVLLSMAGGLVIESVLGKINPSEMTEKELKNIAKCYANSLTADSHVLEDLHALNKEFLSEIEEIYLEAIRKFPAREQQDLEGLENFIHEEIAEIRKGIDETFLEEIKTAPDLDPLKEKEQQLMKQAYLLILCCIIEAATYFVATVKKDEDESTASIISKFLQCSDSTTVKTSVEAVNKTTEECKEDVAVGANATLQGQKEAVGSTRKEIKRKEKQRHMQKYSKETQDLVSSFANINTQAMTQAFHELLKIVCHNLYQLDTSQGVSSAFQYIQEENVKINAIYDAVQKLAKDQWLSEKDVAKLQNATKITREYAGKTNQALHQHLKEARYDIEKAEKSFEKARQKICEENACKMKKNGGQSQKQAHIATTMAERGAILKAKGLLKK